MPDQQVLDIRTSAPRISDAVYHHLANDIASGRFDREARIRDTEIAQELGVSRMPVREALLRLERDGLVEMAASRYTRVTQVTDETVAEVIVGLPVILALLARASLARVTSAVAEELKGILQRSRDGYAAANLDQMVESLFDAIDLLITKGGNHFLARSLHGHRYVMRRIMNSARPHLRVSQSTLELFDEIVDAIQCRDGDRVYTAVLGLGAAGMLTRDARDTPRAHLAIA